MIRRRLGWLLIPVLTLVLTACDSGAPVTAAAPTATSGATATEPSATPGSTVAPPTDVPASAMPTEPPETEPPTAGPGPSPEPEGVLSVLLPAGTPAITVSSGVRARSRPEVSDASFKHTPLLPTGTRMRIVEGPVAGSGYWWYRVEDVAIRFTEAVGELWVASADHDGTPWIEPAPEACQEFVMPSSEISVTTLAELQEGVLGRWVGCVTTPWVKPYWVAITLRVDGVYSGWSQSQRLDYWEPAFYYGTDDDSPEKRYWLHDLQDSRLGLGEIDIVFGVGSINRGDLRNVRLMSDSLEFEFFHRGTYGPLTYRLIRWQVS